MWVNGVGSTRRATLRGGRDLSGGTEVAVSVADRAVVLVSGNDVEGVRGENARVRGSIVRRAVWRFMICKK